MNRPQVNGKTLTYSEILRVIGRYMDRHNLAEARVIETADGFILQGVIQIGERAGQRETYQLSPTDIVDLRIDATAERGKLM
ncbi:MAG TPA: hypothetical protein VFD70_21450 [Anaerolineae bacterium]|nr:hypothetical protein [Anaerolineae bacterium]